MVIIYTIEDLIALARADAFTHIEFNKPACRQEDLELISGGSIKVTIHEETENI